MKKILLLLVASIAFIATPVFAYTVGTDGFPEDVASHCQTGWQVWVYNAGTGGNPINAGDCSMGGYWNGASVIPTAGTYRYIVVDNWNPVHIINYSDLTQEAIKYESATFQFDNPTPPPPDPQQHSGAIIAPDSMVGQVLQNILSFFGALVGVLVFIASTKFGIRWIKKLFPNAY